MSDETAIGRSIPRKDAEEKVSGRAKYTDDMWDNGTLHAVLMTSPYGHAQILSIDTSKAKRMPGVRAVLTGEDCKFMTGSPLQDRPILAQEKVRYAGEPVAMVVADERFQAESAAALIDVNYQPLPVIQSPKASYRKNDLLIHPDLGRYEWNEEAAPVPGTNIATKIQIRKGHPESVWGDCDVVVECEIAFPQAHHAAMESHCATAEVLPDGVVHVITASQSPYGAPEVLHSTFGYRESDVRVEVPFVGGGFGGKSSVFLEPLAVAASRAVHGSRVHLWSTREQDMATLPCRIGMEATVKLGAKRDGTLTAAQMTFWVDGGGYSDRGVIVARAAAQDCTGPYRVPHVYCDAYCMYTNHPPTTSYRGFGHSEQAFVMERAMDELARKLKMDALLLRIKNAILPGDTTPTQTLLTKSRVGNVPECLLRLRKRMGWTGEVTRSSDLVRAQGIACIWKTSSSPPNASSGAFVLVNRDGGVTVLSGVVEIGQGTKTALALMVAEVFHMDAAKVEVVLSVDTWRQPEHWKTVASRGSLLAGNAVVKAAKDACAQLAKTAAAAFGCNPNDVTIASGQASCRSSNQSIPIGELSRGYILPSGEVVGELVLGRGSYTIEDVTGIDFDTGKGSPGPEWTVAAQGVEVELNLRDFSYRVLRAVSVVDSGAVIHPDLALGQMKGGMNMGLSLASREGYVFDRNGFLTNGQFRTYPIHRYGDHPQYDVEFIGTPHEDAPWGLRGLGEHGLIGMPAALGNALSRALSRQVNGMPMTSEFLWRVSMGDSKDGDEPWNQTMYPSSGGAP